MKISEILKEIKKEIQNNKGIKYSDINDICTSSLPYQKKLELINSINKQSNEIFKSSNIAKTNLEEGYYISNMENKQKKIKNKLLYQVPLSLGITGFSGYNIYTFIDYVIDNENLLELQSQDLLSLLVMIFIIPIMSGVIDIATIKSYIDYKKYNVEIDSYKLRLKDKHR